jgi:hypothetical protein
MVAGDDHPVAVRGIDPHVVKIVPSAYAGHPFAGKASVQGYEMANRTKIDLVEIVGGHDTPRIVMGPLVEGVVIVDQIPAFASILRSPQHPAAGFLPLPGNAVPGFDQGIDSIGITGSHGHGDFSQR